jgi:tripartite-type tricarboxylate transporter receptor subunit TctC
MKLHRRQFLHLAAGAAALPVVSRVAWAQSYPSRPVRVVVAAAAGGANDIIIRVIGRWLSERLGQPFIIENRPGGSNSIGTEAVVRAPADGYTLLAISGVMVVNTVLFDKLNFNFIRDIAPVAGTMRAPLVMTVHPSFPAKTIPEFIVHAKANPGKLNFASGGTGTAPHMAGELFKVMTGVNMVHVPYRGEGLALTDLLGGQVQLMFSASIVSLESVKAAKLRALGVTTSARWDAMPDIPTVSEFVPGFEASAWFGVGAPKDTPAETIDKLNKAINTALADPDIKARIADLGGVPFPSSPADLGEFIVEEAEKWGKVIRAANIKLD